MKAVESQHDANCNEYETEYVQQVEETPKMFVHLPYNSRCLIAHNLKGTEYFAAIIYTAQLVGNKYKIRQI